MSEYVPTTDEVRQDFAYPWEGFKQDRGGRLDAFNRWLAGHDHAIWSQGHQAGWEDRHEDWLSDFTPSGYTQDTPNPYRQQVSKRAGCGCDLTGMTPPAVHIVDRHADQLEEPAE